MYYRTICLLFSYILVYGYAQSVEFMIPSQNNTGPQNRSEPIWLCYPVPSDPNRPICVLGGGYTSVEDIPTIFFSDIWKATLDLNTLTVSWEQLPFNVPNSIGAFPQYWRKNSTAFTWTGGLTSFSLTTGSGKCDDSILYTYDFVNQRYETTFVGNNMWQNVTNGACGQIGNDVYCYGGINCTHPFSGDLKTWTVFDIETNVFQNLNSAGLNATQARAEHSVTCYAADGYCLIGHGNIVTGGTIDNYTLYEVKENELEAVQVKNDYQGILDLFPAVGQVWKINSQNNGGVDFKVIKNGFTLVIGGGLAIGHVGLSGVTRIVSLLLPKTNGNIPHHFVSKAFLTGGLFNVTDERIDNIPRLKDHDYSILGQNISKKCDIFMEYSGSTNPVGDVEVYTNEPVFYKVCRSDNFADNDDDDDDYDDDNNNLQIN